MTPRIMAHGGAWDWDDDLDAGKRSGLKEALSIGNEILQRGGPALDAVEQTVRSLENNPVFDAKPQKRLISKNNEAKND